MSLGWRRQLPDMEGSWKCTAQEVVENQQGMELLAIKNKHVTK
jgi:hypothetical protein